jgi:ribosomal protein S28E/S33
MTQVSLRRTICCLHVCQMRYRSLNGRNLGRLIARPLPGHIRPRRLLKWLQIRQNREVGRPLPKQLGQVPKRATLRTLLCPIHLRWQASRREVQLWLLAIRTPKRLRGPAEPIPALASELEGTPEPQVPPPASTAPARIKQVPQKRCRVANKLYRNSQYEL